MSRRARIVGTGSALPPRRATNEELAREVDTTDEWIVERTGIRARHIAGDGETTATLATEASKKALAAAGIDATQIGLIVLATSTPDQTFPASATLVQAALGIDDCIAFDVQAVCTGFLYALSIADIYQGGMADHALVIARRRQPDSRRGDRRPASCSATVRRGGADCGDEAIPASSHRLHAAGTQ